MYFHIFVHLVLIIILHTQCVVIHCISDIVDGGAISQFVAMARSNTQGKLRSMAVEAIRVLSEDNLKSRKTRLRLCEDGAAGALGHVLKDDVEGDGSVGVLVRLAKNEQDNNYNGKVTTQDEAVIKELHQALCAWANILDRNEKTSNAFVLSNQVSSTSLIEGAEEILVKGCSEFLETGGLESLLYVATLPLRQYSGPAFRAFGPGGSCCRGVPFSGVAFTIAAVERRSFKRPRSLLCDCARGACKSIE